MTPHELRRWCAMAAIASRLSVASACASFFRSLSVSDIRLSSNRQPPPYASSDEKSGTFSFLGPEDTHFSDTASSSFLEKGLNRQAVKPCANKSSSSQLPDAVATIMGISFEFPMLDERINSNTS